MNPLECRDYTKIFQTLKGSFLRSPLSNWAEIRTHPSFYGCPHYLQNEEDQIKNEEDREIEC